MKNIIGEKPTDTLHGRTLYCTRFVEDSDIRNREILDIGCGYGWFELDALRRGVSHATGLEISDADLETARKYADHPKIDFKCGSAIKTPFESNRFDTVVSWEVIEHIPRNAERRMFDEIRRVLKPGGYFYMSTPYSCFVNNIFDPAWWLIGHRHYSQETLEGYAKDGGFAVERVVKNGGVWEIVGINNLYVAKWVFRRRPFLKEFIDGQQDAEYKKERGFTNIFFKFKKL